MRLTYVGPFDSVIVPLPTGGAPEVERGQDIDIPDSHAERLLEQPSNWQRASKPAAAKAAADKPTAPKATDEKGQATE